MEQWCFYLFSLLQKMRCSLAQRFSDVSPSRRLFMLSVSHSVCLCVCVCVCVYIQMCVCVCLLVQSSPSNTGSAQLQMAVYREKHPSGHGNSEIDRWMRENTAALCRFQKLICVQTVCSHCQVGVCLSREVFDVCVCVCVCVCVSEFTCACLCSLA